MAYLPLVQWERSERTTSESSMLLLTDLAPEILSKIAEEVYHTREDLEIGAGFEFTMRSLSLSCRAFNLACYPYRFKAWEVVTESYEGLEQHLANEKWKKTVRELLVPIIDLRPKNKKSRKSFAAYDAKLAEVVRSAEGLVSFTFYFQGFAEEPKTPNSRASTRVLERTMQACREKQDVRRLSFKGISFDWQATAACQLLESWPNLHSVEFLRGTGDNEDELRLGETLYAGAATCKQLKELIFDIPMFMGVGPDRTATIPITQHSLTHLDLGDLMLDYPVEHGAATNAILRNCMSTLERLEIWTESLYAALMASPTTLRFPNLRCIHIRTPFGDSDSAVESWAPAQGMEVILKLRQMLSTSPLLNTLHISGVASLAVMHGLLYEHHRLRQLRVIKMDVGYADPARYQGDIAKISRRCKEKTGTDIQWVDGNEALLG